MLAKVVLAAVLTAGVLGRTAPKEESWYDLLVMSRYCDRDKIQQSVSPYNPFKECLADAFSDETFQVEVRQTMLTGNNSHVVKAVCSKSPQLKDCIHTLLASLNACFTVTGLRDMQKTVDKAIDFTCANDGAKLTLFLNEGGTECFNATDLDIKTCKHDKKSSIDRLVGVYGTGPAIPGSERCKLDKKEDDCMVAAMKTCANPLPGQLVEELLNTLSTLKTDCGDVS